MDEGDLLALEMLEDVAAGDLTLLVIAAAGAENVPHTALGDLRIGRRRRDLEDAILLIDFRTGDGHARIVVADNEFDSVGSKIVGDRNALFRIGDIVPELDGQFIAKNATGGVDVGGRLFDAVFHLRAGRGIRARDRAANPEFYLRAGG